MANDVKPLNETVSKKWKNLLEGVDAAGESLGIAPVKGGAKKAAIAQMLEATAHETKYGETAKTLLENGIGGSTSNVTGGIDNVDPILINLVRRLAPNLVAYDMVGVQPMTGPTGLIFALRSFTIAQPAGPHGRPGDGRNGFQTGAALNSNGRTPAQQDGFDGLATAETFYNEVDDTLSGTGTQTSNLTPPDYATYQVGSGMSTAAGERLGSVDGGLFNQLSFTIEKTAVEAKTRALRATYTNELSQDLRAVHGLDAEDLLSSTLATELTAEINREIINTIRMVARLSPGDLQYSNGVVVTDSNGPVLSGIAMFNLDTNTDGRWSNEKQKGLLVKIAKMSNRIAKKTRRGKANFIICSSDVASILDLTGKLTYAPAVDNNLTVDDTGNTFVGILQGRMKVYIDPYLGYDEIIVGYKGQTPIDAGMFYCPYVPLQMVKAVDPNTFQPAMGYKTRYGLVANPFTTIERNNNLYFEKCRIVNL
jgi:hypothetical protein